MAHRKWLYYAFVLVRDSLTARDSEKIRQLVLDHKLSKFSAIEVLGYSFQFGRKKNSDPLKNQVHIDLWDKALEHHYKNNPHHPHHYSDGEKLKKSLPFNTKHIRQPSMADGKKSRWTQRQYNRGHIQRPLYIA